MTKQNSCRLEKQDRRKLKIMKKRGKKTRNNKMKRKEKKDENLSEN